MDDCAEARMGAKDEERDSGLRMKMEWRMKRANPQIYRKSRLGLRMREVARRIG